MTFEHTLHRNENRDFSILFLHSLRATEENAGDIAARLRDFLGKYTPSLVVLNGDTVRKVGDTATLRRILDVISSPMEESSLPWVQLFGNEDRLGGLDNADALPVYRAYPHCMTVAGDADVPGDGNFVLPVLDETGAPVFLFWGMDSHCGVAEYQRDCGTDSPARLPSPLYTEYYNDGIRFAQSMWYRRTSRELERMFGRKIPGILAFHTPLVEHGIVPMNASVLAMEGVQREQVRCQTVCGGMFAAAVEEKNLRAILCGHGETNDFRGNYAGITLGQYPSFEKGAGLLATWTDEDFVYTYVKK